MVACAAVDDGVGAAGIVADHASDHRTIGGRSFWPEKSAVRLEIEIEIVAHHTGLHAHAVRFVVVRENTIQMPTEIDDNPITYDLPGQRSARATGNEA